MREFVLIFDVPRNLHKVELKVNRDLHKLKAKMVQHSVWKHDDLSSLITIAVFIKKSGGTAKILEERFVF